MLVSKIKHYAFIALVVLGSFKSAEASIFYVSNAFNSGFGSFNNALNATQSGDTIQFDEFMNGGFINISTITTIDKSITILGPSKGVTFRRQIDTFLMFDIIADRVIIKNVNFIDGIEGVIKYTNTSGELHLAKCKFTNNRTQNYNTTSNSSVLDFDGNRIIIEECLFENNRKNTASTVTKYHNYIITNHITVTKSVFTQNTSDIGGAININFRGQLVDRSAVISSSSFIDNTVDQTASSIIINNSSTFPYNESESVYFRNNTFANNTCSDNVGTIVCRYGGNVILDHNTIYNNTGGAIFGDTRVRFSIANNVFAQNRTSQLPPLISNFKLSNSIEVNGSNFIDFVPQSLINDWFIDSDNYLQNTNLVSTSDNLTSPLSNEPTYIEGIPVFLPSSDDAVIVKVASPSNINTDQIGHPRTILGAPDLGSVEYFEYGTGIANAGDNITSCGRVTMNAQLGTNQIGKWKNKTEFSNLSVDIQNATDPETEIEFGYAEYDDVEHQFSWSVLDLNTGVLDTTGSVLVTIITIPQINNDYVSYCNNSLVYNGLVFYNMQDDLFSLEWTELNGLRPLKIKDEYQSNNNQNYTFLDIPEQDIEIEISYRIISTEHPSCVYESSASIENTITRTFDPALITNLLPTSVENVYVTTSDSIIAPDIYNNIDRSNFWGSKQNDMFGYIDGYQGTLKDYEECTPYNVNISYGTSSGEGACSNYEANFTLLYHDTDNLTPCLAIVTDMPNTFQGQSIVKRICSNTDYNLKAITLPEQPTLNYQWSINPSNPDLIFDSANQKVTTISFDGTNIPSNSFSITVSDGVRTASLDEVNLYESAQLIEGDDYEIITQNDDLVEIVMFNTSSGADWQFDLINGVTFVKQSTYESTYYYIINDDNSYKNFDILITKSGWNSCNSTTTIPINFGTTTITAGEDRFVCTTTTTLDATLLVQGQIGTWAVAAGNATISQPNNPKSPVSNLSVGQNEFTWTVTQNGNPIATSSVSIYYEGAQLISDTLISACANVPTSISIEAQSVSITDFYSGAWYLDDSLITENASYTLEDTFSAGTYNYTWRVSRGSACSSSVEVVVIAGTPPSFPDSIAISTTSIKPEIRLSEEALIQNYEYIVYTSNNEHGMLRQNINNPLIFTYEANRGFIGQDTILFEVLTACGEAGIYVVITIENSAPIISLPDYRAQGIQAMPLSFNVYDSLGLGLNDVNFNTINDSLRLDPTTIVASAPVSWTVDGNVIVDYSKTPDFYGIDSVGYRLCDVLNACLTGFVRISLLRNEPSDRMLPIEVYNAISPNGDNKHDFLYILNIDEPIYANNRVVIYSRWGDIIYDESGYDNISKIWAGQNKSGNLVPDGTYFYTIYLDKDKGKADNNLIKGYLYVNSGGN